MPIVGLEPSCLLTLRDEFLVMGLDGEVGPPAERALLFEEFLADEADAGRLKLDLAPLRAQTALLHGHCHQKAFDVMPAVRKVLGMIPDLKVETVDSGCCGMAGSFGYEAEHFEVSMKMAELSLLPAVRKAGPGYDHRRRRHQLPPPDSRRRAQEGAACGAGAADGLGGKEAVKLEPQAVSSLLSAVACQPRSDRLPGWQLNLVPYLQRQGEFRIFSVLYAIGGLVVAVSGVTAFLHAVSNEKGPRTLFALSLVNTIIPTVLLLALLQFR